MTTTQTWPQQLLLPGQTAAHPGPIDMTGMYLMHFAFRRDLAALAAAAAVTPVSARASWQALAERWGLFGEALHHHHTGEDAGLWPALEARTDDAGRATLAAMESEHAELDELLRSCGEGFARLADTPDEDARAALAVHLVATRERIGEHLRHEEVEAIAIIQQTLTEQEWEHSEREYFHKGEQAWLFAAGRARLPHARVAVADPQAFEQVQSKVAFARLLDGLGLPQPAWRLCESEDDVGALGFPVWVKAAFSTAGRGVARADTAQQARALWHRMTAGSPESVPVMLQSPAEGRYAQVQGLFDHGRLVAAGVSEQLATGAGGSAAARLSVEHPLAVEALALLGDRLGWHGGLTLDYLHVEGRPAFIECNARTVEPGNAAAAGVNLPLLTIALTAGGDLPARPLLTAPGVRTRSTMAIALGAAEQCGTRRAVAATVWDAVRRHPPLQDSTEVLTPVLADPPSLVPFAVVVGSLLADPRAASSLARRTVHAYSVPPEAVAELCDASPTA